MFDPIYDNMSIDTKGIRVILLSCALLLGVLSLQAQSFRTELWGVTSRGGNFDKGAIFKYIVEGDTLQRVKDFNLESSGYFPNAQLVALGTSFCSTAPLGGNNNDGVIYAYNYSNKTFRKLADFDYLTKGSFPSQKLLPASNGKLYGLCQIGGSFDQGTLFEFDVTNNTITKKVDFKADSIGSSPVGGLIQAGNGKLYGLTSFGGTANAGTLFEYDILKDSLSTLASFNATASGSFPLGSLLLADNGNLYGLSTFGGIFDQGTLFEYSFSSQALSIKVNFNGSDRGGIPSTSLLDKGDGFLYGFCREGGANQEGVLYRYNYQLEDFETLLSLESISTGKTPNSDLSKDAQGILYGMMNEGGTENLGTLFTYQSNSNTFTKLRDLSSNTGTLPQTSNVVPLTIACSPSTTNLVYSICEGSSILVNGKTYTQSGNFKDTLFSTYTFCDSILNITINLKARNSITETISSCDTFRWQNQLYNTSGTYTKLFTNAQGCDSLRVLNLSIRKSYDIEETVEACDRYFWQGTQFTQSGEYAVQLTSVFGCDSIRRLNLMLKRSSMRALVDTAYACQSYVWRGKTFQQPGIYYDTLVNAVGCDSLIPLDLRLTVINLGVERVGNALVSLEDSANYQWIDCATETYIPNTNNQVFQPKKAGEYKVRLYKSNCIYNSSCFNFTTTGVEAFSADKLLVYPNPSSGRFMIDNPLGNTVKLSILNVLGEIVLESDLHEATNTIYTDLPKGLYILYLKGQEKVLSQKISIN